MSVNKSSLLIKSDRGFLLFKRVTSPVSIMAIIWTIAFIMYSIGASLGQDFTYFYLLINQEGLVDTSTIISFLWLFFSFIIFVLGTMFARVFFRKLPPKIYSDFNEIKAFQVLLLVFVFTFLVAFLWIGGAIIQFGGIANLVALAASENAAAREVIKSVSFPGGRLITSGAIGISIFAAILLAKDNRLKQFKRNIVIVIFLLTMSYLAVIPIIMSGRINFFVAILACFISVSYIRKKMIGMKYVFLGVLLLSIVWTAKEYFNLRHITQSASASDQGLQGLIFYFYNDFLNAINTINKFDDNQTYGWFSMRFIFFFTFTDKLFLGYIADGLYDIREYVTAGEVPVLAAPFVDFGYFGIIYIFILGMLCQYVYMRANQDTVNILRYGLICAGLLMSIHGSYLTNQEIAYNLILVSLLARWSKPVPSK